MIMKKSLFAALLIVSTLLSAGVTAQEQGGKLRWKGHETNKFWDNWEISIGAGANTAFSNGSNIGKRSERIGFEGTFSLTKWVHPIVGIRGQLQGGWFNNFHPTNGKMDWPYLFAHGDIMVNFSNWVGGYREDRVYYAVPYIGLGYMAVNFTDNSQIDNRAASGQAFTFAYGLLNKFRVCKQLDIDLEFKGLFAPTRIAPCKFDGAYMYGLSATLGFTYRFNKRDWNRAYSQDDVDGYIAAIGDLTNRLNNANDRLGDANKRINDADAENARLRNDLDKCRKNRPVAAAPILPETSVFFTIGSAKLSDYAKASLDQFIATVKDSDAKFTVTGYADKETGSQARNMQLSKQRAKAVADYLVANGIAASRIQPSAEGQGVGDTVTAYPDMQPKIQRCVIIK